MTYVPVPPLLCETSLTLLLQQLNLRMVQPLPLGACLTAIFDSCHSGTLLDLEHYDCNKIDFASLVANTSRKRHGKTRMRMGVQIFLFIDID